tara:strand:- start:4638 stop:5120 length:483 start_codon:yes stop_codon:yes gene_type:complete
MQPDNSQPLFTTPIRVRWSECDRQGIAFNGAYLEYLEIAQAEYFRNLGYSIYELAETGFFDTVVVHTDLSFLSPVRVDEVLELHCSITKLKTTSMYFRVNIYNQTGEHTTIINAVYVGYDQTTGTKKNIPEDIRTLIESFERDGTIIPVIELCNLRKYIT